MNIKYQINEEDYQFQYDRLLFNTRIHRELQDAGLWYSFYLVNESSGTVFAEFHLTHKEGVLFSPFKAPYGGFSVSEELSHERFHFFVREVLESVEIPTVSEVQLKLPPHVKNAGFAELSEQMLSASGYTVFRTDPHWYIDVRGSKSYQSVIRSKEYARKLKKLENEGFEVLKESPSEYRKTYDFIRNCLLNKGYSVSMDKETFMKYVERLSDKIHVFSVLTGGKRVAASICLQVNALVLYDFMHAHDTEYDVLSPVLKLYQGAFDYARANGFNWLDLGAASLDGLPNYPLIRFKELAGGISFNKFIWGKELKVD